jgi:hypothetical protein
MFRRSSAFTGSGFLHLAMYGREALQRSSSRTSGRHPSGQLGILGGYHRSFAHAGEPPQSHHAPMALLAFGVRWPLRYSRR